MLGKDKSATADELKSHRITNTSPFSGKTRVQTCRLQEALVSFPGTSKGLYTVLRKLRAQVLGMDKSATGDELKTAYRKLCLK